jgi:hypothetical protein
MNVTLVTKTAKKSTQKKWIIGGSALVFVLLILALFMPAYGSERYGLCRVFLELSAPYPLTIRILQVDEVGPRTDIIYSDMDGFGYEAVSRLRCQFSSTPTGQIVLKDYIFDDYKRPPEEVASNIERFNKSIPILMENLPNLALPAPLSKDISALKL